MFCTVTGVSICGEPSFRYDRGINIKRGGFRMDGNARFQEEVLAQLAGIIDRQVLHMVEAAVGSVLRNYEVAIK